jgi:microsomal dipeptidase-like Zn-dependent dipeptidase
VIEALFRSRCQEIPRFARDDVHGVIPSEARNPLAYSHFIRLSLFVALIGASGCTHSPFPTTASPPPPGAPAGGEALPYFAVLDDEYRSAHPATVYQLEALDRAGDADGIFTRFDAVKAGAMRPVPTVDLHIHPFMDRIFPLAFRGSLESKQMTMDPGVMMETQVTLAGIRKSGVNILVAAAYVPMGSFLGRGEMGSALWQFKLMRDFARRHADEVAIAGNATEARAIVASGRIAFLPALEGGSPVQSLDDLDRLYRAGMRMMTIVHFANDSIGGSAASSLAHFENFNYFTSSAKVDGVTLNQVGLSEFGRAAVQRMAKLGIVIDLAHSSDATVRQTLETVEVPVMVSHTGARALHGTERNIPDDLAKAVAERGGTIGVSTWRVELITDSTPECRWFSAHFRHLLQVVGPDHIGLGTDLNGLVVRPAPCDTRKRGIEGTGIRNISDIPAQFQQLVDDGVPPAVIDRLGENALRVFDVAESAADPILVRQAAALPEPVREKDPVF